MNPLCQIQHKNYSTKPGCFEGHLLCLANLCYNMYNSRPYVLAFLDILKKTAGFRTRHHCQKTLSYRQLVRGDSVTFRSVCL